MAELEFNIARLQQCLDVTVGTPSVGDVVQVTSTSPLTFDIAPGGGGTGVVETIVSLDPIRVDNTDPANPSVGIYDADGDKSGAVTGLDQYFKGVKNFDQLPICFQEPSDPEQLTTKKYVDTFAAGLQVKAAVRAATLVAGTLATSFENGDIIDGVTIATNDRILIKNQASAIENGIYTVNASGAPTRATDYDAAGEANAGTFTTVTEGGQNNTQWVQILTGTPAPGTDALNFSRLNISAAVTSIQSPNTAHGTGGTLIGAVKLDSTDIYYSGYSAPTLFTKINSKQDTIIGAATTITSANLTANRALASNAGGKVVVSGTTSTQLGYLAGATSNIQTQINGKQNAITGGATTIASADLTASRALASSAFGKVVISNTTATELSYLSGVPAPINTTYAPIASPTFTGAPAAPTPTIGDNSTNIATTAFVQSALLGVGGSGGGALSKKVTISSAQLLTLNTAPVLVIDAPGAGNYIDILSVSYKYNYIAPAYNPNGGVLALITNGLGGRQITWPSSTLLAQTNDVFQHINNYEASNNDALAINQAVYFEAKTANPTGGNGTIELDIYYRVVSASGSTSSNMLFKHVPLTASQIKNATTSPVTVITSPGAGKVISIIDCVFKLNYVAPAYSTAQPYVLYNPAVNYPLVLIPTSVINSAVTVISKRNPESYELAEGAIKFTNTLADLALGNSTGDLYITYQIITL
jgi:hypothetical protein